MKPAAISATDAKNEFGRVLDRVTQGQVVVVTRHDAPKAVILSFDGYQALIGRAGQALETLSEEFDALVDRMQTSRARAGMKAAFGASPRQLGAAAVASARKRG